PESAKEKTTTAEDPQTDGASKTAATTKKAKPESKYPEPFLEPDCSTVPTDGYLPNAKVVIADVRKKHWDRLKACADAAGDEKVSGEIRTTFRLDPDGVPRCVEAPGAAVTNKDVVNCVVSVYRSFRFPAPKNGSVRVTDGIKFDTTEEDDD
ncbi:MAG: hypothetical protein ACXWP4_22145, partial [Polyangiales bacterium]